MDWYMFQRMMRHDLIQSPELHLRQMEAFQNVAPQTDNGSVKAARRALKIDPSVDTSPQGVIPADFVIPVIPESVDPGVTDGDVSPETTNG